MWMNTANHMAPVIRKKMVSECSRTNSSMRPGRMPLGCLLWAEPFSYRRFVAKAMTTRPVQSAMALPKNDPAWVAGEERAYSTIHKIRIAPATSVRECLYHQEGLRRAVMVQLRMQQPAH